MIKSAKIQALNGEWWLSGDKDELVLHAKSQEGPRYIFTLSQDGLHLHTSIQTDLGVPLAKGGCLALVKGLNRG